MILRRPTIASPRTANFFRKDVYSYLGIGDENGCIIDDGVLIRHIGGEKEITVTDGVHTIDKDAFVYLQTYGREPEIIHLPNTVRKAEEYALTGFRIKADPSVFMTTDKLIKEFAQEIGDDPDGLAYVSLFQSGKRWTEAVTQGLEKVDVNEVAKRILVIINQKFDYMSFSAEYMSLTWSTGTRSMKYTESSSVTTLLQGS